MIGQVLDVKVCLHQERYGIEIQVDLCSETEQLLGFEIVNRIANT